MESQNPESLSSVGHRCCDCTQQISFGVLLKTVLSYYDDDRAAAMPAIVLIGPPGVGKTTIGKLLAERLELPHQDSDDAIVSETGMSIPQIFETCGEPEFRRLESETIERALHSFGGVLSLGGGAVMTPETQGALANYQAEGGVVVFLDMDFEAAAPRLAEGGRPLLSGSDAMAQWRKLYDTRSTTYAAVSSFRVDTTRATPFRVVTEILVNRDHALARGGSR